MSQTIDHRVVEMRFDNKQFEAGAKQTMGTLGKLKEALKLPETGKALEGISKSTKDIKLDGIAAGVEALERRFSTLGIVGMRVIENITDGLMNKVHAAVSFVTDSIVSGGIKRAMNIENAHFQLQALLKDETKVQAVMADAMESVDGTAYAYDEAAKAASQFAASGLQAGEEMLGALKGITGVAAMTNSSFEDISRIFTTVAGNGRLMGDQLLQLSGRGLNAASTLADYFREVRGQAGMTEGTIRDMVSKGKISFKDFSDAMTWAFGDSAKRANETFNGAFSNMKSALARIGAGFISPLVEQNGELVQLFNALRIKINDVKSALIFDEQTNAASGLAAETEILVDMVGKLTKDGTVDFKTFTDAILGSKEKLEDYDEINLKISKSLEKVKESGKISSETLKEFNEEGLYATSTLTKYINNVTAGRIKVSDATKKMIEDMTGGVAVSQKEIEKYVSEGKISFEVFASAIAEHSGVIRSNTEFTATAFKALFNSVKKEGHLSEEIFNSLGDSGINAGKAIKDYMNGVAEGTIRASYSTKQQIEEIRGETELTASDILDLVKEGKISADIFQSSMEKSFGNINYLSKQATYAFLDMVKKIVDAINAADMTDAMEVFYYGIEASKNVFKGLYSVVKPVAKAFDEVFLSFSGSKVIDFASKIETLTSKMKLSEKGSKNLHDAFKGIFDVGKLVADIVFKIASSLFAITKPVGAANDGLLGLIGLLGRGLSYLVSWVRRITPLRMAFNLLTEGFSYAMTGLTKLINVGKSFISQVSKLDGTAKLINSISKAFQRLGSYVSPYVEGFIKEIEEMIKQFLFVGSFDVDDILNSISKAFSDFAFEIENFSLQTINDSIDVFKQKIQDLTDLAMSNEGISTFVTNFKKFGEELRDAFTLDNLLDRMERVMDIFGKFFKWIKDTMAPSFKEFSIGGVAATGGGLGIVYAMIKAAKAFEKVSKVASSIPNLLNSVKSTLVAYQKELQAEALLKTSMAIAVLAGSLVLLSFADTDRLLGATVALTMIAGTLMLGVTSFLKALNKGKELNSALTIFSKGLSKTMKNFGKAVKIKAIGGVVKNFAESIVIVAVSIIALGIMWKKDKDAFDAAIKLIGKIALAIVAIFGFVSIASKKLGNVRSMDKIAKSVLMISASLGIIIFSIGKLMKIKLPEDYKAKLGILAGIFAGLAGLSLALALTARIAGTNELPNMAKTIKSLAVLLAISVLALKTLFNIKLPEDYKAKLGILAGIFAGLSALLLVIAAASRIAGGNSLKATGTILAITAFIAVVVGSLFVLTIIPADKMLKGALALGGILIALGVALYGAGKISDPNAYKTVLAMAITVGVITAALGVLSMVPWDNLLKSTLALGVVLLALGLNFREISKVQSKKALPSALAMIAATLAIAYSLYTLSEQPWEGLLSAAAAMAVTLMAFSKSFEMILGKRWSGNNVKKIGTFLLLTLAIIPIGVALGVLSNQPWEGLLASAVGISAVLLALATSMLIISKTGNIKLSSIGAFAAAVVLCIPIAVALNMLKDVENAIQSAAALAIVAGSLSIALAIMGAAGMIPGLIPGVIAFAAAVVLCIPIAVALNMLKDVENAIQSAAALAIVAGSLSIALAIMGAAGMIPGLIPGVIAFAVAALACIPIASVIQTLSGLTWEEVAKGLITLAGALVVIGVAGVAFGAIAAPMLIGAAALGAFSIAIMAAGVAVVVFVGSVVTALDLLSQLLDGLGNLSDFKEVGKNLINGFINGIIEGFYSLIEVVKSVGSGILDTIKDVLGIHSPSEEMRQLGLYTDEGFAEGILGGSSSIDDAMSNVFGDLTDKIDMSQFNLSGKDASELFGGGFSSGSGDIASQLSNVIGDANNGIDTSPFEDSGALAGMDFSSGFEGMDITSMMSSISSGIDTSSFKDAGFLAGMDFSSGFESMDIDTDGLSSAMSNVSENIDTSSFQEVGEESGSYFITGFVNGLNNRQNNVVSEINTLILTTINAIRLKNSNFLAEGERSLTSLIKGITQNYPEAISTGSDIVLKVVEGIKKKFQDLVIVGTQSADKYLEGLEKRFSTAESIGTNLSGAIVKGLKDSSGSFYDAGTNAADGYVKGLKSKMSEVEKVSKSMGEASYKSAAKALDEHSPSKKMGQVANYAGLGFINSLMLYVSKAATVGKEIGDATYNGISLVMDDLSLTDPVIRPVVDLTNVKESFGEIEAMFNDAIKSTNNLALSTNMQNYKSNNTDQSILQDYISRINKDNNDAFIRLRDAIEDMKERGVNVSVYLEGDAKRIFKLVRTENDNIIATARYNPLAKTKVTKE